MKTIKEWLQELPEPYRTRALNNDDPEFGHDVPGNLKDAISYAFNWEKSIEGAEYWNDVWLGKSPELPDKLKLAHAEETASFWERECLQMQTNFEEERDARKEACGLLRSLMQYGNIRAIEGVVYPEGTHKEVLEKAAEFLSNYNEETF